MTEATTAVGAITHGRQRAAAAGAFFCQGLVFISLTTKLPGIQRKFELSPGSFSILMLCLVLFAGAGSLLGEKIAPAKGSATSLRLGFLVMAVALPIMGAAPSVAVLAVGMATYGLSLGLVDSGTNMQGVAVEHEYGRPIMPTFHAAWTLGGILGGLGALATHQISFEVAAFGLAVVPILLLFAPYLHAGGPITPIGDDGEKVPWKRIVPVGAAMVLFYMVDTAITTWGPTYLDKVFTSPEWLVAVATLPYLVASLVFRIAGDGLAHRFGNVPLVRVAAVLGCVSLAVVVLSPNATLTLVGFFLLGTGVAVLAPLSYSAAAAIARDTVTHDDPVAVRAKVDAIIARFNQFNYVGGLLGAVMTGAVGDSDLRYGFAIPMVLIVLVFPLAKSFRA